MFNSYTTYQKHKFRTIRSMPNHAVTTCVVDCDLWLYHDPQKEFENAISMYNMSARIMILPKDICESDLLHNTQDQC